jgi:hypothetical protein
MYIRPQQKNNHEKHFSLFTALFLLVTLSSCSDDKPTQGPSITTFSAEMLMGSNEVPTNNSTAMGTATLKFNNTQSIYNYSNTQCFIYYSRTHPQRSCWNKWKRSFSIHSSCISISYTSAALTQNKRQTL